MATQEKPPVLQELLQANEKYKSSFSKAALPLPPAKKVAVLACMDARLDPARALGLEVRAIAAIAGGTKSERGRNCAAGASSILAAEAGSGYFSGFVEGLVSPHWCPR